MYAINKAQRRSGVWMDVVSPYEGSRQSQEYCLEYSISCTQCDR